MRFTRHREIGRGTYGIIHSGEIEHTDGRKERGAEKKVYRQNNISGIGILREIQILQMLSKNGIFPKILAVFFEDYKRKSTDENVLKCESVIFVTELLDHNGSQFFGLSNYNINNIIDMSSQLISGVAFMHSKKITHRDLKPSNILINFNRESNKLVLKICDFGFSQFLINSSYSTPGTNSPWYRAPEICWGNLKYNASSDVWAIAATIFEMLTGSVFVSSQNVNDEFLFNEILIKNPNQWTSEIHQLYLQTTNRPIKINQSLNPISLPPGQCLMEKFRNSRYFKEEDVEIWIKFEKILKKCFTYNYKKRISCWKLLDESVFDPVRNQINLIIPEIKKSGINEIIEISISEEHNQKKVIFFENFIKNNPRFPLRQLFHSVDLVNRILSSEYFNEEKENIEKICAVCVYIFHKFFSSLSCPENIRYFFIDIEEITNEEDYYKLDKWIYDFELKLIRTFFPNFKIYRSGIFEMPDEYGQTLKNNQMKIIFDKFIKINNWSGNTYRFMYRNLYSKYIDSIFEFILFNKI